jgi:hypothetical protein
MIDAADFLKWCEVFGVATGGGGGGGGTVTNVGTGTGLTGGPITTTGTISLAPIPDQNFLANTSGGSAAPVPTPLSTFLLAANNLSDLANNESGFTNLGLGSGDDLTIDEGDFVASLYTLTNPCPNIIFVNATTPGNAIKLPVVDVPPTSFIPGQGPVFILQEGFEPVEIQDSSGAPIVTLAAPGCEQFVLTDNTDPDGVWYVRSFVSTVNALSGDVVLTGSNIDSETTPINYTPVDSTIDGHLIGIDNQLGDSGSQDLQDTYDLGADAGINLADNRPLSINTITSAASANAVTTPGTGANTIANYRMGGSVFTVATPRNATALQYLDASFTQPGTREVGIWVKSTGELLGSATIAKTDPLDGSGLYRTKTLDSPIFLAPGIEYVVAATVYSNETNYINQDAVPGTGITLTQSASGPASGSPIPLTFPTTFVVEVNTTLGGFFQFSTFITNDSVTFNDDVTDSKTLAEVKSTTRATIFEPSMTTAQMNAMGTTNFASSVFINDTTPRRPYRYTGVAWRGLAYVDEIPAVPTLTQGQLIIGVTGNPAVAGDITSPGSTLTTDVTTNGQIQLDVARPMPACVQGEFPVGVGFTGNVQQRGTLQSSDSSISINTSGAPSIDITVSGTAINLQNAYNNGSTINVAASNPMTFTDEAVANSVVFNGDGSNPLMQFIGTTNSTIPYCVMTDAEFAIFAFFPGTIAFTTTSNRLSIYDGMAIRKLAYIEDASNSGVFTPSITNVTNTSSISFIKGMYSAIGTSAGNIVTCSLEFSCSVTAAVVSTVKIASLPVFPNTFTNVNQAMSNGGFIYTNVTPTSADGEILDTIANTSANDVNFSFIPTTNVGTKVVTVTFSYIIQ